MKLLIIIISFIPIFGFGTEICFYLDRLKLKNKIPQLNVYSNSEGKGGVEITLNKFGLSFGKRLHCKWSRNGGNRVKEKYSLDGGGIVPIISPAC